MKMLPITPKATDKLAESYEVMMSKLHSYLRPDGLNATVPPIRQVVQAKQVVAAPVYFKPTTNITSALRPEGVGEKIDFRFG
ncbi:hypothetical protein IJ541_01490 [bacterium]|nr:hypothetical protein [bacterium]